MSYSWSLFSGVLLKVFMSNYFELLFIIDSLCNFCIGIILPHRMIQKGFLSSLLFKRVNGNFTLITHEVLDTIY